MLLALAYLKIEWHIISCIPFSAINNISMPVNNYKFTVVFLKAAYHTNRGAEINLTGSNS